MKKKSPFSSVLLFPLIALSLTACGTPDSVMNSAEQTEESGFQEPAEAPEPVTEEELRQAIAGLGSDAEATSRKREYYEKLYAMDLFAEEDYLALAQVYAEGGNWKEQRRMLSRALRLYPCAEYAEMLSAIVVRGDETETELASLAGQIISALEQQDAAALQGLTCGLTPNYITELFTRELKMSPVSWSFCFRYVWTALRSTVLPAPKIGSILQTRAASH